MRSLAWEGDQRVTQGFGGNADAYARFGLAGHNGIDLGCWNGTPLYAVEQSYVLEVMSDPMGYGLTVYLLDAQGYGWRYGHMDRIDVRQGQEIPRGHLLGVSGNTGNSSGPHLHFGMRPPNANRQNGYGGYVDPTPRLIELWDHAQTPEEDPVRIAELEAALAATQADRDFNFNLKQELEGILREPTYRKTQRGRSVRYVPISQADIDAAVARAQGN